jgi:DNA helicase IV
MPPVARRTDASLLAKSVAEAAEQELAAAGGGTVGVVVPTALLAVVTEAVTERLPAETSGEPLETPVSVLSVTAAKGLEFDSVVLVEPALVVQGGRNGLRDLYVAVTRPTQRLVVVHAAPLPSVLESISRAT